MLSLTLLTALSATTQSRIGVVSTYNDSKISLHDFDKVKELSVYTTFGCSSSLRIFPKLFTVSCEALVLHEYSGAVEQPNLVPQLHNDAAIAIPLLHQGSCDLVLLSPSFVARGKELS